MIPFLRGFVRGLQIATLVVGLVTIGGCAGTVTMGPFVPYNAKVCGSDVDCRDGEQCRFPGVDTRAICMPGQNETVAPYPDAWR